MLKISKSLKSRQHRQTYTSISTSYYIYLMYPTTPLSTIYYHYQIGNKSFAWQRCLANWSRIYITTIYMIANRTRIYMFIYIYMYIIIYVYIDVVSFIISLLYEDLCWPSWRWVWLTCVANGRPGVSFGGCWGERWILGYLRVGIVETASLVQWYAKAEHGVGCIAISHVAGQIDVVGVRGGQLRVACQQQQQQQHQRFSAPHCVVRNVAVPVVVVVVVVAVFVVASVVTQWADVLFFL